MNSKPNAIVRVFDAKGNEIAIGKACISEERKNQIKSTHTYDAENGTWKREYPLTNEMGTCEIDFCL